jgi:hypothetical protein
MGKSKEGDYTAILEARGRNGGSAQITKDRYHNQTVDYSPMKLPVGVETSADSSHLFIPSIRGLPTTLARGNNCLDLGR